MAFKNATKGYLNGVTVAAADIEDSAVTNGKLAGSITSDKLSKPYAISFIPFQQATPAAATGLLTMTMPYAGVVLKAYGSYGTAPSSGVTTIDVHVGGTYASHHSVFGKGTKVLPGLTSLKSVAGTPSGALGTFAAGAYLRIDVDAVGSGTKANLHGGVVVKHLLIA
jgi:hypothetical protein